MLPAPSPNFHRPSDFPQFPALPPPVVAFTAPPHFVHANAAAAGLQHRSVAGPIARLLVFPPPLSALISPFADTNLDISPAGVQRHVAAHTADFDRATTCFRRYLAADIIYVNISTAASKFDTPCDPGQAASLHCLHRSQSWRTPRLPRHVNHQIIGAPAIPAA